MKLNHWLPIGLAVFTFGCQSNPKSSLPTQIDADTQQGYLSGAWQSDSDPRWNGQISINIEDTKPGSAFDGTLSFGGSNCPGWKPFIGIVKADGQITMESDLGNPCGRVSIAGRYSNAVFRGTYSAEHPDHGSVKLK